MTILLVLVGAIVATIRQASVIKSNNLFELRSPAWNVNLLILWIMAG